MSNLSDRSRAPRSLWLPDRRSLIKGAGATFFVRPANAQTFGRTKLLTNWDAAKGNVRNGISNATILYVGDSTARSASWTSPAANWGTSALPRVLASQINAALCPCVCDNFLSYGGITGNITLSDGRVTNSPAWSGSGAATIAGPTLLATSAATLTFTPGVAFDTIDIWYIQFAGAGTATVDIGGSTLLTINKAGANALVKQTVTCPLGLNTVNIKWASGTFILLGPNTYDSSTKKVIILNAGWGGSTSSNWNTNALPYYPLPAMAAPAPVLTILDGPQINDWTTSIAVATTKTNMQALITQALLSGDCILMTPNTTSGAASIATQQAYQTAIQQLAVANPSCVFIDQWTNTYGAAVQAGLMYDTLHPNQAGHLAKIKAIMTALV